MSVMDYRRLGRTDMKVSAIGFGAWAIGGSWGEVDDKQSMRALHAAIDAGVNFIDTADVYGDGRSERLVARLRRERPRETIWVATKAGRRLPARPCGSAPAHRAASRALISAIVFASGRWTDACGVPRGLTSR